MTERRGPFWDAAEGRAPMPRAAATLAPDQFQSTSTFTVNFLRPVRPGRVAGKGRVVHREANAAFLEASLLDDRGTLIATATAIARVIPLSEARSAA
jgi:acyl-coenzyme A thioesterase PaaI-like protein